MTDQIDTQPLVLVGVDGTEDGRRAVHYAVHEATRRGARLRIVHVQQELVPLAPMALPIPEATLHEVAAGILKQAEEQARELGYSDPDLETVLRTGPRDTALLVEAADAACVVVGRRSSPVQHLLTGSTTAALATHAHVPVVSVPQSWDPEVLHGLVAVGINGSHLASQTLEVALAEARVRHARLEIVHAWRPAAQYDAVIGGRTLARDWTLATRASLTGWVHELHPNSDVEWTVDPSYQSPAVALHEATRGADLLVLGRHGHRSPFGQTLGSVTRALLRASECPVMVAATRSVAD
jgi:nucleotide-binding universal stress UspA family protein